MSAFTVRNPDYDARVRESFGRQTVMGLLGASIESVEPGRVSIVLPARQDLCQQDGYFHAGVSTTIADSASGYAALSLFDAQTEVLSTEFKVNLLAPALGDICGLSPPCSNQAAHSPLLKPMSSPSVVTKPYACFASSGR